MTKIKEVICPRTETKTWGFDTTVLGRRYRRFGFHTQDEAEVAASGAAIKLGSVGAIAELIVTADLLRQGFDVYRSVSSNGAFDLIAASADARLCRIEVKSAVMRKGYTHYNRTRFDRSKHDVLALVFLRRNEIEYSQSVVEWFEKQAQMKVS